MKRVLIILSLLVSSVVFAQEYSVIASTTDYTAQKNAKVKPLITQTTFLYGPSGEKLGTLYTNGKFKGDSNQTISYLLNSLYVSRANAETLLVLARQLEAENSQLKEQIKALEVKKRIK